MNHKRPTKTGTVYLSYNWDQQVMQSKATYNVLLQDDWEIKDQERKDTDDLHIIKLVHN